MCSEDESSLSKTDIQDVWYEPRLDKTFFQMAKFRLNQFYPTIISPQTCEVLPFLH